jgi:hypothetical protein
MWIAAVCASVGKCKNTEPQRLLRLAAVKSQKSQCRKEVKIDRMGSAGGRHIPGVRGGVWGKGF